MVGGTVQWQLAAIMCKKLTQMQSRADLLTRGFRDIISGSEGGFSLLKLLVIKTFSERMAAKLNGGESWTELPINEHI